MIRLKQTLTIFCLAVLLAACAERTANVLDDSGVTPETRNPLSAVDAAVSAGEPLFVTNCSNCHGPEGRGDGLSGMALPKKPRDLTSNEVAGMTDGQIFLVLKNGKMSDGIMTMPPIRRLSNEQMWQIIAYARTLRQ
ncbi:MAG: cytochrome c [Acidobacteriota bacterium]|nr:MAG: cytochrome c [Acidobacteriota bacterium]